MTLLLLACTKGEPLDSSVPSECGRASEYPDTAFGYEAVEWPEGRSLFGPEPPDQVHDAPDEWATFLDVHGRTDPVPDMDWDGKDVLLWVGEYIACDRRTYDWPESFVIGDTRTVLGFYQGDDSCDSLVWQEAWVFIADEVDDAPEGDACTEPEANR